MCHKVIWQQQVHRVNNTGCVLSHFGALSSSSQSHSASRPLKDPPHQPEQDAVPRNLGGPLPQAVLLPQSPPLPLRPDLCPVQPFVETPVEARAGEDSDNGRSASQTQSEDLFVYTVAPHGPLLETWGKTREWFMEYQAPSNLVNSSDKYMRNGWEMPHPALRHQTVQCVVLSADKLKPDCLGRSQVLL